MTSEELWEKKEIIGCVLVILIFAVGLFIFKMGKGPGDSGTGILLKVKKVGYATVAYDVDVIVDERRMFTERVTNPSGKLKRLTEKSIGENFDITYEQLSAQQSTITSVGDSTEPEKK